MKRPTPMPEEPKNILKKIFISPLRGKKIYDTICSSLEKGKE